MRCRSDNCLSRRVRMGLVQLVLLASWVTTSDAASIEVFFNGPSNFGISQSDAMTARDSAGVPWLTPSVLSSAGGYYTVASSGVLSFAPIPPVGTNNTALESWTVQNTSGGTLEGSSYLLFTHTVPFEKNGVPIAFDPDHVGITIDDVNWVIVPVLESTGCAVECIEFYYPAVMLQGIEAAGGVSSAFDLNYVVTEPLPQAPADSGIYQLPQFAVARGFTPIPEPAAGALLAAGLVVLALGRRYSR